MIWWLPGGRARETPKPSDRCISVPARLLLLLLGHLLDLQRQHRIAAAVLQDRAEIFRELG
ncbi:MAG: hypothetical protein AAGN82_30975 [Myxococcota bacterium]